MVKVLKTVVLGCVLIALLGANPALGQQQTFDSPQAALDAFKAAVQANDKDALHNIFGPLTEELKSGDPIQDAADMQTFARRMASAARLEQDGEARAIVLVGPEEHPFPVPIVRKDGKWFFDTAAGKEEILNRRIGEDELNTIRVCRGYVAAQREYYLLDPDNAGLPQYAQRMASTPGKHDGLFWETSGDQTPSPLGPLVAQARTEGYSERTSGESTQPRPYQGYIYKILTQQDKAAPGGRFKYVINGHMVAGFALVAWPVTWGSSGVMTFQVGPNGTIYQKNLGPKTAEIAAKMKDFSPDSTWSPVSE